MYWGKSDISITFCENKYDHVYWIAEYYNTISSLFYIFVSLFFIKKNYKIGLSIFFIGVGSVLLHGTNRIYGEWVDETSMLCFSYFIIQYIYSINNKNLSGIYLIVLNIIYLTFSNYYIIFFSMFIGLQAYIYYLLYIYNYLDTLKSVYIFLFSCIFWLLDLLKCDLVKHLYFHVFWHIFTAFSIYMSMQKLFKFKKNYIIPI